MQTGGAEAMICKGLQCLREPSAPSWIQVPVHSDALPTLPGGNAS